MIEPKVATARELFEAVSHSIRDALAQRWALTRSTYAKANAKRVYYLSMEFLIGRSLTNNIANLLLNPVVQGAIKEKVLIGSNCWSRNLMRVSVTEVWALGSVLPGVHGHHATPGYWIRSALRVRHV